MAEFLELDAPPQRIEVYDNSHIQGSKAVGAMVVAGPDGFEKGQYRKFNIREAQTNDDFAMMREVMGRRFRSFAEGEENPDAKQGGHETILPDLILIDGGKGQLSSVMRVLEEVGIADDIAAKPPLTVRGIKDNLNFARDHTVAEGLRYHATHHGLEAALIVNRLPGPTPDAFAVDLLAALVQDAHAIECPGGVQAARGVAPGAVHGVAAFGGAGGALSGYCSSPPSRHPAASRAAGHPWPASAQHGPCTTS